MSNITFSGTAFKPELRYTPDGKPVFKTSVSLYTGGNKESGYKPGVWFKVIAFDDRAEHLNQMITEKARITVTGDMQPYDDWTGKDGASHREIVIVAREVVMGDAFRPDAVHPGQASEF